MKVEAIRLKNFRAFRELDMRNIPGFCVLIGANGTGKSSIRQHFNGMIVERRVDFDSGGRMVNLVENSPKAIGMTQTLPPIIKNVPKNYAKNPSNHGQFRVEIENYEAT